MEKKEIKAVLVFLIREGKVLLGEKTGGIGKGRLNGPGGKVNEGESMINCAVRETFEETGVIISSSPADLEKVAEIRFHNIRDDSSEEFVCVCVVYFAKSWKGEPQDSEELIKQYWYNMAYPPLDRMMASDWEWLPKVMSGVKIIADAYIGDEQGKRKRATEIIEVGCFLAE